MIMGILNSRQRVTTYIGLIAQNIESDGAIRPLIDHRSSRMGIDSLYSYKAVRPNCFD